MASTTSEGNKRNASQVVPPLGESNSKRSSGPHHGYSTYVREFRTVLHHPMGLPLIRTFHSKTAAATTNTNEAEGVDDAKEELPRVKEYFSDFFADHGGGATVAAVVATAAAAAAGGGVGGGTAGGPSAASAAAADAAAAVTVDGLFQRCHASWRSGNEKNNEPALTKTLAKAMGNTLKEYSVFVVRREAPVPDPLTLGTARMDVLVSKKMSGMDGTEADRPLLVVEVGLGNKSWWSKVDQALKYIKYKECFGSTEGALFAVVTLEDRGPKTAARLGVFLITPKVVQYEHHQAVEFRVSLLWHDETDGIDDLSKGFGRVLRATCQLPGFIAAARSMLDRGDYRYLGPNCCRIKVNGEKWVLRSYDNRACYTERRPDVYLYSGRTGGETKVVCDIHTGRPKSDRDFGTYPKDSDTLAWLWKKDRGTSSRLLVIATPFREGRHYATSPRDFLPVVEHLEQLHAAGYVHGDIRCFNLAMGPKGGLFDFDLGGKLQEGDEGTTGVLKYPCGYNPAVRDGTRLGNAKEPITKFHDVYALTKVIFGLHVFQPGNIRGKPRLRRLLDALFKRGLDTKKNELSIFGDPSEDYESLPATELEEKISTHMAEVKQFLENAEAQQWIVYLQSAFKDELVKYGCFEPPADDSSHRREGSGAATGSPPKKLPPEPTHTA